MRFNEIDLLRAQKKGIISEEIFNELVEYLSINEDEFSKDNNCSQIKNNSSKYNIENFLYYFGAFIIISTMLWYLESVWISFGHIGLFLISVLYFVFFTVVGNFLWKKEKTTPAGLLSVCAVSIVPVLTWAFEGLVGISPDNFNKYSDFNILLQGRWILIELCTIVVGCIFLKYRKFPLLTLPICFALWYLFMDIVPLCLGQAVSPTWGMRNFSTFVFSIIILISALKLDNSKKIKEDYAYWLYILGAIMFWCVIISIIFEFEWDNEFIYFMFALFNIFYMFISVILRRKVFMILGAIGFWIYLAHLVFQIFKDTPIFPIVLVILGLLVIFFGIYYSKNCETLEYKLRTFIGINNK